VETAGGGGGVEGKQSMKIGVGTLLKGVFKGKGERGRGDGSSSIINRLLVAVGER